jgi:integrase
MSRRAPWPPKIYLYGDKEIVRLRRGGVVRDITLGPAGSAEARAEYLRIVAEMEATGTTQAGPPDFTVGMLADWHLDWAEKRYERRQYNRVKTALRPVVQLYGHTPAASFGPLALETVRAAYVAQGYCRKLCNRMTDCVRWAWRRAAGKELVPTPVADALYALAGLRKREKVGEVVVVDHPPIPPVPDPIVEETLSFLGAIVADMVRLQRLTGMRPGEVCVLRPGDIERPWRTIDGVVMWVFKLDEHKTDWRGHQRWVPIGPQAQALLAPYLQREPSSYCFSPAEARAAWEAAKRAARKSKVQPSQLDRHKARPKKQPGQRYTTDSYGQAIARACRAHGIAHWAPNQIRHQVLEQIEAQHDQEDARCVAGHTTPTTTALYTRGVLRAARVLAKLG